MSSPSEKDETANVLTPGPKKRGRKRKSEMVLRQVDEIVEVGSPKETTSRRGRRRKQVNYYELANPVNADSRAENEIPVHYLELDEIEPKKRKKDLDVFQVKEELPAQPNCENVSNGCSEQVSNGNVNESLNDEATHVEATTSTPDSKDSRRYNFTGETVKMMNTLFNLFADQKSLQDSNTSFEEGNNSLIETKRGPRKGRKPILKDKDLDDGNENVICAICNTNLDKTLWTHHKQRYHNNLAWRVGDPPLDLNDQSFVMYTLNNLYKKKKPLYCDKCGKVKKSVVGFLSHRSQCLKSEEQLESVKIECELCGRKMLPVSLSTHMKIHTNPPKETPEVEKKVEKVVPSKRSAAKKAMRFIDNLTQDNNRELHFSADLDLAEQEFAKEAMQKELEETQFIECKFKCNCITTSIEDAISHLRECSQKPSSGFVCKKCLLILPRLEDIIYHIEFTHEIIVDDDDSNYTEKDNNSKLPDFLQTHTKRSERVLFPKAFKWTYEFCEENFCDTVFENLPARNFDWLLLPSYEVKKFLPKLNESCFVAYTNVTSFINPQKFEYSHRKYKLFESELQDNKLTLFCGGPIASMTWLPTPYNKENSNQILAVSVLNSPDEKYVTNGNYFVESAIQFWDFGVLKNNQNCLESPKLGFGLALNHGPIWHMEFCPSGCHNDDRLGLLAVAGSDSICYIYSIPILKETGLFYRAKPVMKLLLQRPESPLLGGLKYYPSKISWSKACGHQYMCVGYTNGFLALFNLKSNAFILKFQDSEGISCILPSKCFQAHSHAITALSLYHSNGGCRWVMSGSFDRIINIWDLENSSYPICSTKKNLVTDGFWFSNWLNYATSSDESSTFANVTTMLKQIRDYIYDANVSLTCSHSTISAIAGSDWLNGIIHGNVLGELIALFPHQIHYFPEHQKILKNKRLLFGYTALLNRNLVTAERLQNETVKKKTLQHFATKRTQNLANNELKSDPEIDELFVDEPVLYEDAEKKYYLLFCDNKMKSYEDFPKDTSKQLSALSKNFGLTTPNQYPLNSVNKICFNPNRQSSLYLATGYQAGFVRVSWLEFLKSDKQIK